MICSHCQELLGKEIDMEVEDVAGPADPRTGDVWTFKAWVCPTCDQTEYYDEEDLFDYEESDDY